MEPTWMASVSPVHTALIPQVGKWIWAAKGVFAPVICQILLVSTVSFPFLSIVGHCRSLELVLKHHEGTLKIFFRKLCCPECNPGDKELIPECKCPAYSVKENPPREAVLAGQTTLSLMQMICIPVLAPCLVTGWGRFMDRCLSSSTVNSPALQCRL